MTSLSRGHREAGRSQPGSGSWACRLFQPQEPRGLQSRLELMAARAVAREVCGLRVAATRLLYRMLLWGRRCVERGAAPRCEQRRKCGDRGQGRPGGPGREELQTSLEGRSRSTVSAEQPGQALWGERQQEEGWPGAGAAGSGYACVRGWWLQGAGGNLRDPHGLGKPCPAELHPAHLQNQGAVGWGWGLPAFSEPNLGFPAERSNSTILLCTLGAVHSPLLPSYMRTQFIFSPKPPAW